MICPTGKAKNFFDKDWTRQISLKCFYKFDFARMLGVAGVPVPDRLFYAFGPAASRMSLMVMNRCLGSTGDGANPKRW